MNELMNECLTDDNCTSFTRLRKDAAQHIEIREIHKRETERDREVYSPYHNITTQIQMQ